MRNLNSQEPQDANKNKENLLKRLANNSTVKAALLGGGLLSTAAAVSACTNQVDDESSVVSNENVGTKKQALSLTGWETPVSPSFEDGLYNDTNPRVFRNGDEIKVIFASTRPGMGSLDIWVVGSNDGGSTWSSPAMKQVANINSAQTDTSPVFCPANICGKDTLFYYNTTLKSASCDYDTANDAASNCASLTGDINAVAGQKFLSSVDSTYIYYGSPQDGSTNVNIYRQNLSTGIASAVTSVNTNVNDGAMFVGNNYVLVDTYGQAGNLGVTDIYAFDWDGNTASNPVNLNNITGSAQINNTYGQGAPYVDNLGDLWYVTNSSGKTQIMWAKKKQATQTCNNGVVEGTEACDGANLNNKSCTDYGYTGGSLSCNSDCTMNTSACTNTPDGGTGGSAGQGGAGGAEAGVGGSAGTAGMAGTGGAAGEGGSAGEGGAAGTGGAAGEGGAAGQGGAAGEGGSAGTGGAAGEGGAAGTGGAAGEGGSAGLGGAAGEGGAAGQGGSIDAGPGTCFAKVDKEANFNVTNCTDDTVEANVKAPVTIEVAGKTFNCFEGQGTFTYTLPNVLDISTGLECEKAENPDDPNKLINNEFGVTMGFEGTKTRSSIPAELNPEKTQGKYVIGMIETLEGQQRVYKPCKSKNVKNCEVNSVSGLDNGAMPAGTKIYIDLTNGVAAVDPNTLKPNPPVTKETGDGGGCSVCSIKNPSDGQDSTRNALMAMGLVAALAMARRKR